MPEATVGTTAHFSKEPNDPKSLTVTVFYPENTEIIHVNPNFRVIINKETFDPEGFFDIGIDGTTKIIRVDIYKHIEFGVTAELAVSYFGKNGPSLADFIAARHPKMKPANMAWLGYKLARCDLALQTGKDLAEVQRDGLW